MVVIAGAVLTLLKYTDVHCINKPIIPILFRNAEMNPAESQCCWNTAFIITKFDLLKAQCVCVLCGM